MFDLNEAVCNIGQEPRIRVQTDRLSAEEQRQFDADWERSLTIEEFRAQCKQRLKEIYA